LRILIYTHAIAPKIGGVETYVMLLARGLARRFKETASGRLQVTVATPTPPGDWDDSALPFRMVREPGLATLLKLLWHADVVHLAGPTFLPMLFGLLFRKRLVVEHDGYQACCPNGLLLDERTKGVCPGHFMARHYSECVRCNAANVGVRKSLTMLVLTFPRRWLCAHATRNVAPSGHVGRRVALPRTLNIYHGVPEPPVIPGSGNGHPTSAFCFAYVGRLVWEKGVPVLLAAARELVTRGYDFRLKIIGDGPDRPKLEEMTDRYGLRGRTVFTGYLQGDALQSALQGVPVTVMPSVCEDVAPLAAAEHMLQGRLLIGSEIGGLAELIDDVGLKSTPGDVEGLASCLQRVLDVPDLAKSLGTKARERALRLFLEERMVAEHLALYRCLATTQTSPGVPMGAVQ
jgi:glycosyltransferase involved in cell wall biosynthesis